MDVKTHTQILLLIILSPFLLVPNVWAQSGEDLFKTKCASCHTLGVDKLVGPGLGGVAERRDASWLIRKVVEPDKLVAENDPVTKELVAAHGMAMPNLGVARAEAEAIVAHISSAGSSSASQVHTPRGTPSSTEASLGREFFQGTKRFANGGVSCNACHNAFAPDVYGGGSLAVDLTHTYSRLGAPGVEAIIKNPPFPVMGVAYKDQPLTEQEVSALLAFLQETDSKPGAVVGYGAMVMGMGFFGALFLIGFFSVIWRGRRKESVNQEIYDRQLKSS